MTWNLECSSCRGGVRWLVTGPGGQAREFPTRLEAEAWGKAHCPYPFVAVAKRQEAAA